jgi:glycolate oxidase FAD binding subunit
MATRTRESAREALAAALGQDRVREGGEGDAIDGTRPQWVATVDGTESTAAAMRVAAEHELRVVPRGSGSKIDWAQPPDAVDLLLDLSGANEVLEHAAGDLVVHTRAGTPIADVQRAVSQAGQRLAIDQPLSSATVGGVIATATSGPGRHLFGGVRDLLIGITVVRADGTVTVSGGKVVKNVAGYDLGKLYTGSFGTLGVITEAIFRLHPLAAEQRWISLTADDADTAGAAVGVVRQSQAMPTAIEVDREPGGPISVCAHIEGRESATHARALELADAVSSATGQRTDVLSEAPPWWGRYPFDLADGIGLRLDVVPSALSALLAGAHEAADREGVPLAIRGAAGLGAVHAGLPGDADPATTKRLVAVLRELTGEHGGQTLLVRAPRAVLDVVDPWGPVAAGVLNLMRRTKDQFDPTHRLAPGRFVGGI